MQTLPCQPLGGALPPGVLTDSSLLVSWVTWSKVPGCPGDRYGMGSQPSVEGLASSPPPRVGPITLVFLEDSQRLLGRLSLVAGWSLVFGPS